MTSGERDNLLFIKIASPEKSGEVFSCFLAHFAVHYLYSQGGAPVKKFFSYDSKPMQAMMNLGCMILMNFLYLVCCIPIVTMGAAQAGLLSGMRHMRDDETETSCLPAFFKGMKSGFKTITLVHSVSLLPMALIAGGVILSLLLDSSGYDMPVWLSGASLLVFAAWHTMLVIFHATFACSAKELVRNSFRALMAFPFQSLLGGILLWLPAFLLVMFPYFFLHLLPLLIALYYSLAYEIILRIMKKPLQKMKAAIFPEKA